MTCIWSCAGWCAPGGDPSVCRPYTCVPGATSCPGSVCLEECSGNATSGGETAAEPFPLLLVYIPASVVAVLLLCCGILCWRLVRRSCRVPELSLPTVQLRRQVPPPADPLARQLQEATERALQAPIEDKDVVPKSFSVLDPTRKEVTRVGKLLEEWEEEEHRFLHINNEEQAQLVGRSGFADGRSSWSRRMPYPKEPKQKAVSEHERADVSLDQRFIPPLQRKGGSGGESKPKEDPLDFDDPLEEEGEASKRLPPLAEKESSGPTEPMPSPSIEKPLPTLEAQSRTEVQELLQRVEQLEAELKARRELEPAQGAPTIAAAEEELPEKPEQSESSFVEAVELKENR
ncbi:unnamed protein product [Effrenium voratum]|nr:unnamed protein product [Effrenium voratum]